MIWTKTEKVGRLSWSRPCVRNCFKGNTTQHYLFFFLVRSACIMNLSTLAFHWLWHFHLCLALALALDAGFLSIYNSQIYMKRNAFALIVFHWLRLIIYTLNLCKCRPPKCIVRSHAYIEGTDLFFHPFYLIIDLKVSWCWVTILSRKRLKKMCNLK